MLTGIDCRPKQQRKQEDSLAYGYSLGGVVVTKERGRGTPRSDVERVMSHYGIDRATAEYWLTIHPAEELLPERGAGIVTGQAATLPRSKILFKIVGSPVGFPGMEFTILDVWAEYNGNRVTEVPVGERFRVKVEYSCNWPEKPWYEAFWVVSLTATEGLYVAVYDNTKIYGKAGSGIMTLDNPQPAVMPNTDIILTIQPWGSSNPLDWFTPPPEPW